MIRLTSPTVPAYVSSGWGASRAYRGGWHAGMDFPAKKGTPILAAADGTISYAKNYSNSFAGKFAVIDHGGGVSSRYLHADQIYKRVGDRVRRGDQIGTVGTTGTTSSAPHVHFDIKLKPSALAEYEKRYGRPTTGFSKTMSWGRGAPAETFMDKAQYKAGVLESSLSRGVRPYKPGYGWLVGGVVAAVLGLYVARYI